MSSTQEPPNNHQAEMGDEPMASSNGGGAASATSTNGAAAAAAAASTSASITTSGTRLRLPVPQPEKTNAKFWSFLKQCIGKELTKITMPVQWNEPLSLLQRVSEYMNYAHLLRSASDLRDESQSLQRLEHVAAFAVSSLAANLERMGKPFNPLLGETYELQHGDFRLVCEQVGHHPPVTAFHAEAGQGDGDNDAFRFHGSVYPKVKFWGKSIEFQPKGVLTVELPRLRETYTWNNVNCVVHNILLGTLWMEQQGTMEIVSRTSDAGLRCVLSFKAGGWFPGEDDLHTVEGFVVDKDKRKVRFIYGRWTEFLCSVDLASLEAFLPGVKLDKVDANASNLPKHAPLGLGAVPNSIVLWQVDPRPDESAKYYNFSAFTMGLNEQADDVCRTDSRQRPDIRALENGDLDLAASEKERLETKQREYRKPFKSKKESDWWTPRWFEPCKNVHTQEPDWKFGGQFWQRKLNDNSVPDIF